MKRQAILLLGLCLLSGLVRAQEKAETQKQEKNEILEVQGSATYSVGENEAITLSEAREKCILRAKVNAIKNVYGERIIIHEEELNDAYFQHVLAESGANWLKDVGKPVLSASYQDSVLTFTAEVKGMIREVTSMQIDVKYAILTSGGRETNKFKDGERFILRYSSPADGYVVAYLLDDFSGTATRILPYKVKEDDYSIRHDKTYTFFNEEKSALEMKTENADNEQETNRLVIISSKNHIPPCEHVNDMKSPMRYAKINTFNDWLFKCQSKDEGIVVRRDVITILKK